MPITTFAVVLRLTRLSIILLTNVKMDLRARLRMLSKLSTRLAPIYLSYTVHERARQSRPPQVLLLYDRRSAGGIVVHPPFVLGFWPTSKARGHHGPT